MFSKIIDYLERLTLKLGRIFLVFTATGIVIGVLIYALVLSSGAIFVANMSVEEVKYQSSFETPKESPIDKINRDQRIEEAQKSFASNLADVEKQIRLSVGKLRKEENEISSRLAEKADDQLIQNDMKALAKISSTMAKELEGVCSIFDLSIKQQFENIDRDLKQIAQKFDVKADSISTTHNEELTKLVRNDNCVEQSQLVISIADNLRLAYPGDWGLPDVYSMDSANGERRKAALNIAVGQLLKEIKISILDEKYLNKYFSTLNSFTEDLAVYYVGVSEDLESSNKMTAANAKVLATDISAKVGEHIEYGIAEYIRYERESSREELTVWQRVVTALGALAGMTMMLYVLVGVLILLIAFSIERHSRFLKKIEK